MPRHRCRLPLPGLLAAALWALLVPSGAGAQPAAEPLQGREAEEFLRTAEVVEREDLPVGVSRSWKATLSGGQRTAAAVWKTIDDYAQMRRFESGGFEVGFRDSYKHEIAAYELDKLLGLGVVPPTVERRIRRQAGSMQLWIDGAMTALEWRQKGRSSDDPQRWNQEMYKIRLLRQLTYDTDFNNIRNVLVDPDHHLWAIDFSRAFRLHDDLPAEGDLIRFPRQALENLRHLDFELLRDRLGRWLTKAQIRALLERRDRIVALAERLAAQRGEENVLFP